MDFWKSLIGGNSIRTTTTKPLPPQNTPELRLAKFKRVWQSLLVCVVKNDLASIYSWHAWRNGRERDPQLQELMRGHIKRLTDLLIEEEKRSVRLCMNFAYDQQIYIAISKIAQNGSPAVVREAINVFSTLIENEDEDFLSQQNFAQSLIDFLQRTTVKSDPTCEAEFVEFLFGIAAKIRLNPSILPVWFTTSEEPIDTYPKDKFAGATNKEDFPLFYLLLDYVHHEGRIGDFARTGLLYIIESASASADLERWIVDSDLATLMASGLGALYSQLSRKLIVAIPKEDTPVALILSDDTKEMPGYGAVSSNSPDFQVHMETFLSYLVFWQDVLEHCRSSEVKQTLLDHFQVLFLEQLLYPSLLESSDVDGGSSVAVLTYLRVMLDTLEHPELIQIILSYLLSLPSEPIDDEINPTSARKRRKSLSMLSDNESIFEHPSPALYSLVDLILANLESASQLTVNATLRLVSTLLRRHHPYTTSTLINVIRLDEAEPFRPIGGLNAELDKILGWTRKISDEDEYSSIAYEAYLHDHSILLESHPCSRMFLATKLRLQDTINTRSRDLYDHAIRSDDLLLSRINALLKSFFSNAVETNLFLTSLIIDMAACCHVNLKGWLLEDPSLFSYEVDSDDEDSDDDSLGAETGVNIITGMILWERAAQRKADALQRAKRTPILANPSYFMIIIDALIQDVSLYKEQYPNFDEQYLERKQAFRFTDNLSEALSNSRTSNNTITFKKNYSRPHITTHSNTKSTSSPTSQSNTPRGRPSSPSRSTLPGYFTSPAGALFSMPPPQRGPSPNTRGALASPFGKHIAQTQQLVDARSPSRKGSLRGSTDESETSSVTLVEHQARISSTGEEEEDEKKVTMSHLLTNIVILQEFLLELAALIQVRSALYGEIAFV